MAKRKIEVAIVGDADSLAKALGRGGSSAKQFGKDLDAANKRGAGFRKGLVLVGKTAGVGMVAGVGAGVIAVKSFIDKAKEAETSNARMRAQLKASGISFKKNADQIEKVIQKTSQLSGLDDEDLQDSFTNIVRVTGDVNKSLKLTGLAADFARAKHIDVAKAGEIVAKVAGGNTGVLGRYGIKIKEGASATEALGLLQQKFAGQAKAYGDTSAGAQDKLSVALENLQEVIGAKLLPVFTKVVSAVAGFITQMQTGEGAGGHFRDVIVGVFTAVRDWISGAISTIRTYFAAHREDIDRVIQAVKNIATAIKFVWDEVALPIVQRTLPAIVNIVKGAFDMIKGLIKVVTGVLTGDFGAAWEGVKSIFRGSLQVAQGILRAATAPFREIAAQVGGAISGPISSAWDAVKGGVRDLRGWLSDRWDDIKGGASAFATGFKNVIVGAFEGAVNRVIGFVNRIIDVVNVIPGVPNIGHIKPLAQGGVHGQGFARGGAFARTGGIVGQPITLMGEEAPLHPEFVIPTNPRYRKRAQELMGQAADRLGMYASGGVYGNHSDRMGGIIDIAKAPFDLITKGAKFLLDKLPDPSDLGWLAGLGKWAIDKVGDWIKDKVTGLFGSAVGAVGGGSASWGVVDSLAHKYGLSMTSGFRPGDPGWHGKNRARDYSNGYATGAELQFAQTVAQAMGKHLLELIHTPLGWGIKNGNRVGLPFWGSAVNADHFDHVHVAMARGGVYAAPYVGSFKNGGRVPRDGMAYVHRGEEVVSARDRRSGPMVHIEHYHAAGRKSAEVLANKLAYRVAFG